MLNLEQQEELEKYLIEVNNTSKLQVALLTIPSLEEEQVEDYSMRVAQIWKLGDKERNSGALLLIAKKEKKIRVEVGYGLEKDLTDAVSSQIIRNVIAPHFKENDHYNGIKKGLEAIVAYSLKDETLIKEIEKEDDEIGDSYTLIGITIFLIFLLFVLFGRKGITAGRSSSNQSRSFSSKNDSSNNNFSGKGGRFGGGGATGGW